MLKLWDKQFPGRIETIFTAMQNTAPSQGVDRNVFDFLALERNPDAPASGEVAEADLPAFDFMDVSNSGHIDLDNAAKHADSSQRIEVVGVYQP